MRSLLVLGAVAALIAVMATAGSGAAAPLPKAPICHYDADTATFHIINISENAYDKHVEHGDVAPGDFLPGAVTEPLTDGWDSDDSGSGSVEYGWILGADCGSGPLRVIFTLDGATTSHSYTAGAHFVGLDALAFVNGNVTSGSFGTAGWFVADSPAIVRDGISSGGPISAADFGILSTDELGDGTETFDLAPGSGAYGIVFTVRVGTCDLAGDTGGCSVHYRTGEPFMDNPEAIAIP